jgi:hypothetical protein
MLKKVKTPPFSFPFKTKFFTLLSLFILSTPLLKAAPPELNEFSLEQSYPENLVVNNRILLKINGKAVSVMDVVRKMDLLFYRQYPELVDSPVARYQFYMSGWRTVLGAVIDDSLIMADAEEKEVEVNDGEVREELEKLFGPNVVLNLDKLGMTLDEAFDLLKIELTVQRMTAIMVRNKAITAVHPTTVKERYAKILAENPPQNYWVYRILSIRGPDHERVAKEAYRLLSEQQITFEEIASAIQEEGVELSYSEEYNQNERDLSLSYKAILQTLALGNASAPLSTQKGSRLFCLKEIGKTNPPSFKEVEEGLTRELTQDAMTRYHAEYRAKLRKQYGLTPQYLSHNIPDNLHPFALR